MMVDPSRVGNNFLFVGRVPDSGKVLPTCGAKYKAK